MPERKLKDELELFYSYLRQNGLKKTHQKDLILETFLNTEGHLSVEDVYALVKRRDKRIGIVTVFRTLKSLTACGIAKEITLGDGLTRFEHSYHHPHHHHIVCTECNKTIEFVSPELERIQLEIVGKYGFLPIHHRLQIYGACEDCREHRTVTELSKHDTERVFARDAVKMALYMEKREIEFYRAAAARNLDPLGKETLETIVREGGEHLSELEEELQGIYRQDKSMEKAPMFLHFDPCELERLMPGLGEFERDAVLRMDARQALDMASALSQRAANFFKEYAEKFLETKGKRVFQRFAEEEMRHHDLIRRRREAAVQVS
jgi:Fur family ferric uptake transcriptional regulator